MIQIFKKRRERKEAQRRACLINAWWGLLQQNHKAGEKYVPKSCRPFDVEDFVELHEAKYIRPVVNKELGLAIIFYKK